LAIPLPPREVRINVSKLDACVALVDQWETRKWETRMSRSQRLGLGGRGKPMVTEPFLVPTFALFAALYISWKAPRT
jgi:hypothetical protein